MHIDHLRAVQAREKVSLLHDHGNVVALQNNRLRQRLHSVTGAFVVTHKLRHGVYPPKTTL